jgi:hypothetical protein
VTEQSERPKSDADDLSIPDDEIVYRRLSYSGGAWVQRDSDGKLLRPVSGGFQPDDDGLSVFRRSILQAQQPPLGPDLVALRSGDIVVGFTVGDVRTLHLGVRDDAWPQDVMDPDHPRYVAHALIVGWHSLGKKRRIAIQKQLCVAASMDFVLG